MSGGQQSNQSSAVSPWKPLQPYIKEMAQGAQDLYHSGGQSYNNMFAEPGQLTQMGQQYATEFGQQPNYGQAAQGFAGGLLGGQGLPDHSANEIPGVQNYLQQEIDGKYLDPNSNPALQGMMDRNAQQVQSSVGSQFALGGRSGAGSGAFANAMVQGNQDFNRNLLFNNYNAERDRQQGGAGLAMQLQGLRNTGMDNNLQAQLQAANLMPQLDAAGIAKGQFLQQSGMAQDDIEAQRLAEANRKANFGYENDWDKLQRYLGIVNGAGSGYSTQTQPMYRNKWAGAAGGALAGASLGAQLGTVVPGIGNVVGAGVGGLAGGLLGLV